MSYDITARLQSILDAIKYDELELDSTEQKIIKDALKEIQVLRLKVEDLEGTLETFGANALKRMKQLQEKIDNIK